MNGLAQRISGAASSVAVNYVTRHPILAGISAVSLLLTPVLGVGWVVALPLKALGFGAVGIQAGKSHIYDTTRDCWK